MSGKRVYVDIDDVLSATIECLVELLHRIHDRRVAVEDVCHFDLEKSFELDRDEIAAFMDHAHRDEIIESIEPTEGAADVLGEWAGAGHEVRLVTGRPPSTYHASRRWLARHAIPHDDLHHLDKWGRPRWNPKGLPALRFEDLPALDLSFAVEDSLETAVRLVEQLDIPVALMDRPWNRDLSGVPARTRAALVRCRDWDAVAKAFDEL
jgi:uncharacterized HAD superfamily protein